MTLRNVRALLVSAFLAATLVARATSDGPPVVDLRGPGIRITLPDAPGDVGPCIRQAFPDVPDRALTRADIVRIIGTAKVLYRTKSRRGERALAWITTVHHDLAK